MSMPARRNMHLQDALGEAEARFTAANPMSQERNREAARTMPGGNTRSILFYPPFPLVMTRGEGAHLWDLDGHRYTDFLGEYTAGLYGHSHPVIQRAVSDALESGIVLGAPNQFEARLAELVCARFASCAQVRFCNSGTEANLMALSAARAVTGRDHVMAFEGAYHGGVFVFAQSEAPMNVPFPMVMAPYNDRAATLDLIERYADDLAAIIVEPMMGAGGGIAGDRDFLQGLRDAATRHGIVLVFDEVMTSRLSPGGLQAVLEISPDMTTFGKYLGGGLTFGAFGGNAEIMGRFDPGRPDSLLHSGTYNNNVLTMAAGVAGLSEAFTPEAALELNAAGDRLRERLNALARERGVPVQVTGLGSILTVHFQDQPVRRPADTEATDPAARALFHLEMLARGFYISRRGFMSLSLPLEAEDYEGFAAAFDEFLVSYGPVLNG